MKISPSKASNIFSKSFLVTGEIYTDDYVTLPPLKMNTAVSYVKTVMFYPARKSMFSQLVKSSLNCLRHKALYIWRKSRPDKKGRQAEYY